MHYCINCGSKLPESNPKFCSNCGFNLSSESGQTTTTPPPAPVAFDPAAQMKKRSPDFAPAGLDKATFMKRYSLGRQKCLSAAILGYASAGITAVVALTNLLDYINIYSYIDVAILLVLSLLVHLLRSRVASIILLVYALCSVVIMVIDYGQLSGWWGLMAGVLAVIGSFQCVKEWKTYQARTQNAAQFF